MARAAIQRGGTIEHRCGINGNHRTQEIVTVQGPDPKKGPFVLEVCPDCAENPATLDREFARLASDLRATIAARR